MATTYARLKRLASARWSSTRAETDPAVTKQVRNLIAVYGRLPIETRQIDDRADLFDAGLRSFAAVQLFMAIEDTFDIKFEDVNGLASIEAISAFVSRSLVQSKKPLALTSLENGE